MVIMLLFMVSSGVVGVHTHSDDVVFMTWSE